MLINGHTQTDRTTVTLTVHAQQGLTSETRGKENDEEYRDDSSKNQKTKNICSKIHMYRG